MQRFNRRRLSQTQLTQLILSNLVLAIAYVLTANLSLELAVLPGQIPLVWIPSGITLAAVLTLGWQILPGIALGSVLALSPVLLGLMPAISLLQVIELNVIFAATNCLQAIIAQRLLRKWTRSCALFSQVKTLVGFVAVAIAAPMLPAALGITAWCSVGLIPWSHYGMAWLTWWLARALTHLLFTPPLLLWRDRHRQHSAQHPREVTLIFGLALVLCWLTFGIGYAIEYMLLPILIAAVFRLGPLYTSLLVSWVSAIAIVMTAQGQGPFVQSTPEASLLLLQSFTAVCSLTTLMLSAIYTERQAAQASLTQTLDALEQLVAERTAQLQQSDFRTLVENVPDLIMRLDRDCRYLYINPTLETHLGVPPAAFIGKTIAETGATGALLDLWQTTIAQVFETAKRQKIEFVAPSLQGLSYYASHIVPEFNSDGSVKSILAIVRDISDRKRAEEELEAQRQFLQQVIDAMPSPVFVKDLQGRFLIVNQAAAEIHGTTIAEMLGRQEFEFNPNCDPAQVFQFLQQNQEVVNRRAPLVFSNEAITDCQGVMRWYQTIISPFLDLNGEVKGVIGNSADITERRQMELALRDANEELQRRANLDGLTQIANRRRFDEYLLQSWCRLIREQQPLSLILCDVDYFKRYNDRYGHQAGDECLIKIAQALCQSIKRSTDLVARYGGEEFAIVLPNTPQSGAEQIAQQIRDRVSNLRIPHADSEVHDFITVSLGLITQVPQPDEAIAALITKADQALYQAKAKGRNRYCYYELS